VTGLAVRISVIIPAAGSGSRMGSDIPKPFLQMGGLPILSHTLRCFDMPRQISEIVLPVSTGSRDLAEHAVAAASLQVPVRYVEGGDERMYSIWNALQITDKTADLIAVHDAVRPFVSTDLWQRLVDQALRVGAAIPGLPVTDTIKITDNNNRVVHTPPRETLRSVQTPQVFAREILWKAYQHAMKEGSFGTDDASLVEQINVPVMLVQGEKENFKITYPADIRRAEEQLNNR